MPALLLVCNHHIIYISKFQTCYLYDFSTCELRGYLYDFPTLSPRTDFGRLRSSSLQESASAGFAPRLQSSYHLYLQFFKQAIYMTSPRLNGHNNRFCSPRDLQHVCSFTETGLCHLWSTNAHLDHRIQTHHPLAPKF